MVAANTLADSVTAAETVTVPVKRKRKVTPPADQKVGNPGGDNAPRLETVKPPFTMANNTLKRGNSIVIKFLPLGGVMSMSVRAAFTVAELTQFDNIMDELRDQNFPLVKVENMSDMFNFELQWAAVLKRSPADNAAFLKTLGADLDEADFAAIAALDALKKKLKKHYDTLTGPYAFAAKTSNESKLILSANDTRVSNGSYQMTTVKAQKVWERAYAMWSTGAPGTKTMRHSLDQYDTKTISFGEKSITVGCQTISRWQAEQLALEMGWISK